MHKTSQHESYSSPAHMSGQKSIAIASQAGLAPLAKRNMYSSFDYTQQGASKDLRLYQKASVASKIF
jgi:hypothetical protein